MGDSRSGNGGRNQQNLPRAPELKQIGMRDMRPRLVIQSSPMLVLQEEWLAELYCPACGETRWFQFPAPGRARATGAGAHREQATMLTRRTPSERGHTHPTAGPLRDACRRVEGLR